MLQLKRKEGEIIIYVLILFVYCWILLLPKLKVFICMYFYKKKVKIFLVLGNILYICENISDEECCLSNSSPMQGTCSYNLINKFKF